MFFEDRGVGMYLNEYFGIFVVYIFELVLVIFVFDILIILKWKFNLCKIWVWRFLRLWFKLIMLLWRIEKFVLVLILVFICLKLWGE